MPTVTTPALGGRRRVHRPQIHVPRHRSLHVDGNARIGLDAAEGVDHRILPITASNRAYAVEFRSDARFQLMQNHRLQLGEVGVVLRVRENGDEVL